MKKLLLCSLLSIFLLPSFAYATDISSCGTIIASGNYILTKDLTLPSPPYCIDIQSDDVVIDLNGYTISGSGGGTWTAGIYGADAYTLDNISIINGSINLVCPDGYTCSDVYLAHVTNLTMNNTNLIRTGAGIYNNYALTLGSSSKNVTLNNVSVPYGDGLSAGSNAESFYLRQNYYGDVSPAQSVTYIGEYFNGCGNTFNGITYTAGTNVVFNTTACSGSYAPFTSLLLNMSADEYTSSDYINATVNMTGGTPPYNLTIVIDGIRTVMDWTVYGNASTWWQGFPAGNHSAYAYATDSLNVTRTSNTDYFIVQDTSWIIKPTLTINPVAINLFTNMSYATTAISNGTPPYNVEINTFAYGSILKLAECEYVNEGGTCSGSVLGQSLIGFLPSGKSIIWADVVDASLNVTQSNAVEINIIKSPSGQNMNLTFRVTNLGNEIGNIAEIEPNTVNNTNVIYNLTANFTGGYPPFKVIFWDLAYRPICTFDSTTTTYFDLYLMGYSGTHNFGVTVYSSDGQVRASDPLTYEISQAGSIFRLENRVFNCEALGGTVGAGSQTYVGVGAWDYGGTEEDTTYQDINEPIGLTNWTGILDIIRNPQIVWTIILIGFATFIDIKTQSKGLVFFIVLIIGMTLLSLFGIYPTWLLILEAIIAVVYMAFFIRSKVVGGG